jgi:hypothetical protein
MANLKFDEGMDSAACIPSMLRSTPAALSNVARHQALAATVMVFTLEVGFCEKCARIRLRMGSS